MSEKWKELGMKRKQSWLTKERWTWGFLNIWCLFDIVLFPLLFLVFGTYHFVRKRLETEKVRPQFLINLFHLILILMKLVERFSVIVTKRLDLTRTILLIIQLNFNLIEEEEEEEPLLIYTAQGSPFRRKKLSVINGSPEQQRTKTTLNI